jgi:hypothetical protein
VALAIMQLVEYHKALAIMQQQAPGSLAIADTHFNIGNVCGSGAIWPASW